MYLKLLYERALTRRWAKKHAPPPPKALPVPAKVAPLAKGARPAMKPALKSAPKSPSKVSQRPPHRPSHPSSPPRRGAMGAGSDSDDSAFAQSQTYIARRVAEAIAKIPPNVVQRTVEILLKAPEIFVYGAGRSGIIGRAFAMRLVQVGLAAFVIGESTTPIVRAGDAVFILSGRGESQSSIQTANIVRREGAQLVVLTGRSSSKLAHAANLAIPLEFPEDTERPGTGPPRYAVRVGEPPLHGRPGQRHHALPGRERGIDAPAPRDHGLNRR